MSERAQQFDRAYGAMISDFSKRGALNSSGCAQYVAQLYGDELKQFGQVMLTAAEQVCDAHALEASPNLEKGVIALLHQDLGSEFGAMEQRMLQRQPFLGLQGHTVAIQFKEIGKHQLLSALAMTRERITSDVRLYVARLKSRSQTASAPSPSMSVSGQNVFIARDIHNSNLTTTQTAAQNDLDQLLVQLTQQIESAPEHPEVNRDELRGMVEQIRAATQNSRPNQTLVKTLLQGTAGAVRTVGTLAPAYESVRQIASLFGFALPPLIT